ncbi:hypothetical protein B5G50_01285 [Brevibacillus brevis]|uniref:hypothetical protein n=1 Tax=Brevibacillus brevis TaxID=1393 RepID=UPI000B39417F|nr:hypothetical protein [Brevibacillus brevis]OUQ90343.1 hypothetical protein B5G50_01285 [Brevibacillus brevis]UIO42178.1 hypothetical protein LOY85_25850 [Brevibacillus brevis]
MKKKLLSIGLGISLLLPVSSAYAAFEFADAYTLMTYSGNSNQFVTALGVTRGDAIDAKKSKAYIEIYKDGVYQDSADSDVVNDAYSYAKVNVTDRKATFSAKTNHKIWDYKGKTLTRTTKDSLVSDGPRKKVQMNELRSEQENARLSDSWDELRNDFILSEDEWDIYDYFDTDLITQQMSEDEATSFNDTVLEAIIDVREKDDLVPAVLVNKELNVAKVLFEREEGAGTKVAITLEKNGDSWAVGEIEEQ